MHPFVFGTDGTDPEEDSGVLEPQDTLEDLGGVTDVLDTGWSPAERPWAVTDWGTTEREELAGESLAGRLAREVLEQQQELIAAEACHHVGRPQLARQAIGHLGDEAVAGAVTEAVINHLEVIDIGHDDSDGLLSPGRVGQRCEQPLLRLLPDQKLGMPLHAEQERSGLALDRQRACQPSDRRPAPPARRRLGARSGTPRQGRGAR